MRTTRIILITQLAGAAISAPVLFYIVGFSTQPRHVGMASLITCIYIVVSAAIARFVYQARVRLHLPDQEGTSQRAERNRP